MKKTYRTTKQVKEITGISSRRLKYFIERDIIKPSHEEKQGDKKVYFYSESDVLKIKQIMLYKELDYSEEDIKRIVQSKDFNHKKALDEQIVEMRKKKKQIENKLLVLEMIRLLYETSEKGNKEVGNVDISDFDNDIDKYAIEMLSPDKEDEVDLGIAQISYEINNNIDKYREALLTANEWVTDTKNAMNEEPESKLAQQAIEKMYEIMNPLFENEDDKFAKIYPLFILRLIRTFSVETLADLVFGKANSSDFLEKAIIEYIDKKEETVWTK